MLGNLTEHQQKSLLNIITAVGEMKEPSRSYFLGYTEALANQSLAPKMDEPKQKRKEARA